jgi:hypothetical protein
VAVEQFTSNEALSGSLQVILQTWPLYRVFSYTGADAVGVVPKFLSLFCGNCDKDTFWEASFYSNENNKSGFSSKAYECRNCSKRSAVYYFYWKQGKQYTEFFKVGQYPELEERVSPTLEGALTSEDLRLYKNALRLRNFNLGIAAVAYMRRVVENRMNDMLAILYDAARVHNAPPELLARHEVVMNERRFSTKVDYAGDLLPKNLRPDGHPNPMAVLHELASEGLHAKSDAECVDIFDECRQTFEYVFGKMRVETEDAITFVKGMTKLADKRAKAGEANKK